MNTPELHTPLEQGSSRVDAALTSSVLVTFILAVAAFVVAVI